MAAIKHFVKQDATARTTNSTTGAELTDYTIAFSDLTGAGFAAGDDVLILAAVRLTGTSANGNYSFAVGFGTTFAGRVEDTSSQHITEPVGTNRGPQYLWLDRKTLVNNENIYFRGQVSVGTTATYDDFFCIILKLGDLGANDFLYAEATHSGDAPDAYNTDGAGVTTAASGDWLFFTSYRFLSDSTSGLLIGAIHDGTTDISEIRIGSDDLNDTHVIGTMAYKAGLGSGVTVRARYRVGVAATHDIADTRIFGLRLDAFEDHAGQQSANTVTHSALDTYSEFAGFGSYSLTTTGPFVVFGLPIHVQGESTKGIYGRIQIGGSDWPVADAGRMPAGDPRTNGIYGPFLAGYAASQSSGTLDIDLDAAEDFDVTPNYSCTVQIAAAFSLTLSPSGVSVTPTTVAQTLTGQAPTVQAASAFSASTATLALTGFAPTFAAHHTAAPTTGTAALTGFAPTVTGTVNVTSAVGTLALTGYAPTAEAGTTVQPSAASAGLTGFAPTIEAGAGLGTIEIGAVEWLAQYEFESDVVSVTPDTAALALVGFAPSVEAGTSVTPDTGALVISGHAPSVETGASATVEPSTAAVALTGFAPSASAGSTVEPSTAAVVLTGFAPDVTVTGAVSVTPSTAALISSGQAPTVAAGASATPDVAALVLAGDEPTLQLGATVEPSTATLAATGQAPTVVAGEGQQLFPSTAAALLTGAAPTVTAAATVTPTTAALAITGEAPTVSAGTGATVAPDTGSLALTGYAPDVSAISGVVLTPATASLVASGQAPSLETNHFLTAETGSAVVTGYAPSIIAGTGAIVTTETGTLVIVGEAPTFAGHVFAAANTATLTLVGWPPSLEGEQVMVPPTGSIAMTGYPPFVIHLPTPARRVVEVGARNRPSAISGNRLVPVGAADRQAAVTGRRRVIRVGARSRTC